MWRLVVRIFSLMYFVKNPLRWKKGYFTDFKWMKGDIPYVLLETDCFISCLEVGPLLLGNLSGPLVLSFRYS